jgi:hypothetical protein
MEEFRTKCHTHRTASAPYLQMLWSQTWRGFPASLICHSERSGDDIYQENDQQITWHLSSHGTTTSGVKNLNQTF